MLRQVKNFKYLGYEISYENERNIKKLVKFSQKLEILNKNFKPALVQKFSRMN
jgi:hypothetical protein